MDTHDIVKPYTGDAAVSVDKVVPALNELAQALLEIAERHGLTETERNHILGRLCEQLVRENNEER